MRMIASWAAFNQIIAKKLLYSTLRRLSVSSVRIISFPFYYDGFCDYLCLIPF